MKKYLYRIRKFKIKPWIKYWILNKEKTSSGVLSEILTGTSFTLENSLDRLFNKFDLKGNTLQDGEPTPDSPIPIQNVSGNNTIKVQNKNLCNSATFSGSNLYFYANAKNMPRTFTLSFITDVSLSGNSIYATIDNTDLGVIGYAAGSANEKSKITLINFIKGYYFDF